MSAAIERPREFHCPLWPGCGCPEGTVAIDCPGRTIPAELPAPPPRDKEKIALCRLASIDHEHGGGLKIEREWRPITEPVSADRG